MIYDDKVTLNSTASRELVPTVWSHALYENFTKESYFHKLQREMTSCPDFNSKSIKEWWVFHHPQMRDFRQEAKEDLSEWFSKMLDDKRMDKLK